MKRFLLICVSVVLPVLIFYSCAPDSGFITVSFTDTDMGSGEIAGILTITPDETTEVITHYAVYWGSSETEKLADAEFIAEIAIAGGAIEFIIPENTAIPPNASHLLVFVKNGVIESDTGRSAEIIDRGSTVTVSISTEAADISSYTIVVSGTDMESVTVTVAAANLPALVEVPDGTNRSFDVTAHVNPANPGVFLSYTGSTGASLTAGETATVSVSANQLEDMKIVIPDKENRRIVQIDNMNGDNWLELTWEDFGFSSMWEFDPIEINFDAEGKIYIANGYWTGEFQRVYVIDNMNDTTLTALPNQTQPRSMAVDAVNGIVYYADSDDIWYCDLDGSNPGSVDISLTNISTIYAMDADDSGLLYISGHNGTNSAVFKLNPATETVLADNSSVDWSYLWDILVKDSEIYVVDLEGGDDRKVLQFDTDLVFQAGLGSDAAAPQTDPETTDFFGPHRFVALPARKIYIIDENESDTIETERIVSFDDITGSDWDIFHPGEIGESAFQFFMNY